MKEYLKNLMIMLGIMVGMTVLVFILVWSIGMYEELSDTQNGIVVGVLILGIPAIMMIKTK